MIADQEWRKTAIKGQWYDPWPWTATSFFDHFEEEKDDSKCSKNSKSITHALINGNNGACHDSSTACGNMQTPFDLIDADTH
jgi:hypothetical protein